MTEIQKVCVCPLTGVERQNWLNPDLALNLITMGRDLRFDVTFAPVRDYRPWEAARNTAIVAARHVDADWCIQLDNDNFLPGNQNLLDILAAAKPERHHVIGLTYAVGGTSPIPGETKFRLYPDGDAAFPHDGPFAEVERVAGGVLMIHKTVWQKISKGPWFVWHHPPNSETLRPDEGASGEDVSFCDLCRQHGLRVWTHSHIFAGHYRTTDLTGMVCTMAQLNQRVQIAQRALAPQAQQWVTIPR